MNRCSARLVFAVALTLVTSSVTALPDDRSQPIPDDRSQPIQLEASRGQLDQKTGISVYEGNVVITQGSMRLAADRHSHHLHQGQQLSTDGRDWESG